VRGRRRLQALLTTLGAAAGMLAGGGVAAGASVAEQLRPVNLRVLDAVWHAENRFAIAWDRPPLAFTAISFRVRDEAGGVITPETRVPWDGTQFHVHTPAVPGRYTLDLWLEGSQGEHGQEESVPLLFDDRRPAPVRLVAPTGWIAGNTATTVRIEHPDPPAPISGIRGYAFSVDRGSGPPPCAGPDRCSEAETDLRAGAGDDRIALGLLPEGASVVRAVAVSGSGMRSPAVASATVHVDATKPAVSLSGLPQGWSRSPVLLTAAATDALSGMAPSGPDGPFTALAVDGAVATAAAGSSVSALISGDGSHRVAFYARDAAGNVAAPSGPQAAPTATVRIDGDAPDVAFARSQDPADPERIEATVADRLSGPDPGRGSIAVRPAGSRRRFEPLPTTVSGNRLIARWDSDSFPSGDYEFRATAYDRAGNPGQTDRRSDGARLVLPNPLKVPTAIEAGFGGRRLIWQRCGHVSGARRCRRQVNESFEGRPQARAVPYGRGVQFGGRLRTVAGAPLIGKSIEVVETFDAGAGLSSRTTTVTTADDGVFVAHLAPGPSRHVEAVFAGDRTRTRVSGGQVRLGVLAGVRLRASAGLAKIGGAPIVFGGRLAGLGPANSPDGRAVELQFRLPGSEWSEFRTVRTDPHGRFRYPYRFSDDDSRGVRFQFRAFAPAQDDWPYEPAASRPIFVTGH
jgi:hypothetical protein